MAEIKNVRHIYLDVQITEDNNGAVISRVARLVGPPQRLQNFTRIPIEGLRVSKESRWPLYLDNTVRIYLGEDLV